MTAAERKAIERAKHRAGLTHVSGWIRKQDKPEHDALVKRSEKAVNAAMRELEGESECP